MINLFINDRYYYSLDELKELFVSTPIDAGSMLALEIYERVYGQDLRGWLEEHCPDKLQLIKAVKQIDSAPTLPIDELLNRVIALFTGDAKTVAKPDFANHAKFLRSETSLNDANGKYSIVKLFFQIFQPINVSYLLELKDQEGKKVFASQQLSLDVDKGSADISIVFKDIPATRGLSLVVDGTLKVFANNAYHVGDYYKDKNKEGIVFWVDSLSSDFKIVSMDEARFLRWSLSYDNVPALSSFDGLVNMRQVQLMSGWRDKYPAFAWCASLGDGWYLPAKEELELLMSVNLNKILTDKGGIPLESSAYWSSTVAKSDTEHAGKKAYRYANFDKEMKCVPKDNEYRVRAVSLITSRNAKQSSVSNSSIYKIGDYYDDGTKQGVVFEVDESGRHGKIVSLKQSKDQLKWATAFVSTKYICAQSKTNGAANMDVVKQQPNWIAGYPAFAWCASLGEGWYLPAIEELKRFTLDDEIRNAVNKTIKARGGQKIFDKGVDVWYWSSTEWTDRWAMDLCMSINRSRSGKYDDLYVRAVSTF